MTNCTDPYCMGDREGESTQPIEVTQERFYIDCEFDGHNGPLLSMALVKDDGDGIHIQVDAPALDLWVARNVVPLMDEHRAPKSAKVYLNDVGSVIRAFLGDCRHPVIVADSPVDIARFCSAISTGTDGQWASADYPAMSFEVHNVDCYPTDLPGAVQHNAWWDAMALRHRLQAIASTRPTQEPVCPLCGKGKDGGFCSHGFHAPEGKLYWPFDDPVPDERARVVAWLRGCATDTITLACADYTQADTKALLERMAEQLERIADAIERGDHMAGGK